MRNKLELKEQAKIWQWCAEEGHKYGSINNGTSASGWGAINDNKMAGTVKGLPDLIVIINGKYRVDGRPILTFIEVKKEKGGIVSPEQNQWITAINHTLTSYASVCHGAEMAKDWIRSFYQLKPPLDTSFTDSLK